MPGVANPITSQIGFPSQIYPRSFVAMSHQDPTFVCQDKAINKLTSVYTQWNSPPDFPANIVEIKNLVQTLKTAGFNTLRPEFET
jgi:hypothetical protein